MAGFYIMVAVLLAFCLRGQGSHATLVVIFLAYTGLYVALSRDARKRIKKQISKRSAFWLVGVPTLIISLASGRNITPYDNYGAMLTTASIVQYGTNDLTQLMGGRDKVEKLCGKEFWILCTATGSYSSFPSGIVPFALPIFALARLLGANLHDHDVLWHLASFTSAFFAAGIGILVFLLAQQIGSFTAALWVTAFVVAGSAVFSTVSQGLWSHNSVTLCLIFVLWLALRRTKLTQIQSILIGVALSLMIAGRIASAVMVAPILLWLVWRDWRSALLAGLSGLLAFLPWLLFYQLSYGHPLGPQFLLFNRMPGGFAMKNIPVGLYGLLGSPGTGLFIFQPWALLLLLLRKRLPDRLAKGWKWVAGAICLALLFEMSSWIGWSGQWCWGTRYLTEIMPVLAILCVPAVMHLLKKPAGRRVLIALMAWSFLVQANYVYGVGGFWSGEPEDPSLVPENAEYRGILLTNSRCLDWRDPAFLYPYYQRFFPPPQYKRKNH